MNVIRSVLSFHLFSSSGLALPFSAKVSALSFRGSPRCDLTLTKNVALPASILIRSSSKISRKMSASGASASVARPPCPTHFLTAFSTDSLSHRMSTSSLSSACLSASTTPPSSGRFELVPSSSLPTLICWSAPGNFNLQHPDPIHPLWFDPSIPNTAP